MDDETGPEKEPETPPAAKKGSQSMAHKALVDAWGIMEKAEPVTGSHSQLVNAALLGVCLLFIAAMLGVQKIDAPLTVALVSFSIAIPMLVNGFVFSKFKVNPAPGHLVLVALQLVAFVVEKIGWTVVVVGVYAVIAHLSPLAFNAMIITSILVVVLSFTVVFIVFKVNAWRQAKKQGGKQDKNPPDASGGAPLQTQ